MQWRSESKQTNGRNQRGSDKGGHRREQTEGRGIKGGIEATKGDGLQMTASHRDVL